MNRKILLCLAPLSPAKIGISLLLNTFGIFGQAQTSLLDQVGKDADTTEYVKYSFKTNRVINLHSLESTAEGVFDFKVSHRFKPVDEGFYDLFGLDGASQRFGGDYGITNDLTVTLNRNSYRKAFDLGLKYRFLRQSTGKRTMPITAALFSSIACETQKYDNPDRVNYFSSRLFYVNQLIIGRKFNDYVTLEIVPTHVHRNLVPTAADKNDVFALGFGGRLRLSRRITFNAEYVALLTKLSSTYKNSMSVGVDIETGGHVFQLHFTNSPSMAEYSLVTQTETDFFAKNSIRFGFNISRVFTIYNPKKK